MPQNNPMLEVYIYENAQLLEQLEDILLTAEKAQTLSQQDVDEIFRIMHTIKGSSAMMSFDVMAKLSHAVEDLFSHIREHGVQTADWTELFDVVLAAMDFLKAEMAKITNGQDSDGDFSALAGQIAHVVDQFQDIGREPEKAPAPEAASVDAGEDELSADDAFYSVYKAHLVFEEDCKMENVRAFGAVTAITEMCARIQHSPKDLMATGSDEAIAKNGLDLYLLSEHSPTMIRNKLNETLFLQELFFQELSEDSPEIPEAFLEILRKPAAEPAAAIEAVKATEAPPAAPAAALSSAPAAAQTPAAPAKAPAPAPTGADIKQSLISVNILKLDKLMNLVGEIVTTEAMVAKNPDLAGLELDNFNKSVRQLRKLTDELQDVVMSIRMIPISTTFHKMHRIVRDMSKKINKDVDLVIVGEETELDKNIIDNLSDPIMHIIRNSMDHGLETAQERTAKGKPAKGKILLEARNTGGDVVIIIQDDGRGLNREKIIEKAIERGVTTKPEAEITDKEAFSFILLPGFSTKDVVSEFSGRGVGMDVVRTSIEKVGGSMSLDSVPDQGMTVTIRIPLTLAIMDGMQVMVGASRYIVPVLTIHQSFKPKDEDIIIDPSGNEMIVIRDECHPIIRLSEYFRIPSNAKNFSDGIMIMVESEGRMACLFADELIGELQAVVKPLPPYIAKIMTDVHGLAGCTLMGDGSISLILNITGLLKA